MRAVIMLGAAALEAVAAPLLDVGSPADVVVGAAVVVGVVVVVVDAVVVGVAAVVVGVVVDVTVVVTAGGRCWEFQHAVTDATRVVVVPFPQTTSSGRPLADALALLNASAYAIKSALAASAPSSVMRAPRSHLPSFGVVNPIRPAPFATSVVRSPVCPASWRAAIAGAGLLQNEDRPAPPACAPDRDLTA